MHPAGPIDEDVALPALREELQILRGSPLIGGAPSWLIYDPVQSRFFQVGIEVFEILSLWSAGTIKSLISRAHATLGRTVKEQEVTAAIAFLASNNLTRDPRSNSYRDYFEQYTRTRRSILSSLTHSYLFFRIPLVKPDRFLQRTLPYIEFLYSKATATIILAIMFIGIYLVSRQWASFSGQFAHLFTAGGVALYLTSLIAVKIVHELGHAYTATRLGARVPTMGVAFLVMMPVLYTDTTDAWRLKSFRHRAYIDCAGMAVELAVAGLATFLWAFLTDGMLRSAVFALATTSWVMSLLINLNPFMRFDGYYLLADSLGVQNLQPRSFALSKWRLREFLFGLSDPSPEPSHQYRTFMTAYGYSVWIYRFFLFLGIALLVYALFFKALGVILFFIEIAWFIGIPIMRELTVWWNRRSDIVKSSRSWVSFTVLAGVFGILLIPWSGSAYVPAILSAEHVNTIYTQHDARIERVLFYSGMEVSEGDLLLELHSPAIDNEIAVVKQELALLRARQARRTVDRKDRDESIVLQQQFAAATTRLKGLTTNKEELRVKAAFRGTITDVDETLHEGRWVNVQLALGTLADTSGSVVRGYVDGHNLRRVKAGQVGVFIARNITYPAVDVRLKKVAPADNAALDIPYLASIYGGEIPSRLGDEGEITPVDSVYVAEFEPLNNASLPAQVLTGVVKLKGEKESFAKKIWRSIARVTVRELGV